MTDSPIAIVGAGYMGGGIAQVVALSGRRVQLADVDAAAASASRERLIREAGEFAVAGIMPADAAERCAELLVAAASIEDAVADADIIEEAAFERLEVKHSVLARISAAAPPHALIGSNTSTIAIGTMATAVVKPERFLGIHFSNPSPFIPGVEVIPHASTSDEVVARAEEFVRSVGKSSARVKDSTGFVLNRLQYALLSEAARLVDEGVATVDDVDTIARSTFGFRLPFFGPFAIADMAGLDVYRLCFDQLHAAYGDRFAPPELLDRLVAEGHLGAKSGGGFYPQSTDVAADLVAYRTLAYGRLPALLQELGPSPLD